MHQHGENTSGGQQLAHNFQPFRSQVVGEKGHARHVDPRAGQSRYQTTLNWITSRREHDRDRRGCIQCSSTRQRSACRDNHGHVTTHKISCQVWQSIELPICPAVFGADIHTFPIALRILALPNLAHHYRVALGNTTTEAADDGHCGLLRACLDRPRKYLTQQGQDLSPPHSITSSARASRAGGTVRPRVFAVLRLNTSSNWVGCWTGRSATWSPFKMRSMYTGAFLK